MKITSILLTAIIATATSTVLAEPKTALLAEVKQILALPLDETTLTQNAYVALVGMDAPEGMDNKELGKKIILATTNKIRQGIQNQDPEVMNDAAYIKEYYQGKPPLQLKLSEDYSVSACHDIHDHSCLKIITDEQPQLAQILQDNQTLYKRYQELITLPSYYTTPMSLAAPMADFMAMIRLSNIRVRQAVLAINDGQIDNGVEILQQEINFFKQIIASKAALIDQMLAFRRLLAIYHTVSELLDTPALANQLQNPKLAALLKPFSKQEQQAIAHAFDFEKDFQLISFALLNKAYIIKNKQELALELSKDTPLTFDRNATLNSIYQKWIPIIKIAAITLPEAATLYQNTKAALPSEYMTTEQIYQKYGQHNILGGLLIEQAAPDYEIYLLRFYNLVSYLALINTKLTIKQAAISKQQLPDFLSKLGEQAKNPYSHAPFEWDADKQLLSSEWLNNHKSDQVDGDKASVYIKFK